MSTTCPSFPAAGECDTATAMWCDATTNGLPPATLDCSTVGGTCGTSTALGAWCAVPNGTPCAITGQSRASYLYCGDATGPSAGVACDLDKGCTASNVTCTPGMATPYCDLDKLIVDCTPWGQPVQRQCTQLGATGCAAGACVGVPMGGSCGPSLTCVDGYVCDSTTHTCGFQAAAHPKVPQVITLGGPVLAHPKAMPISWSTDPEGPVLDALVGELTGTSSYWHATTSEYGVGPLTSATPVHLTTPVPASLTDANVVSLIQTNTTGANPAWGAIDTNTIYIVNIPNNVPFDDGTGAKCCSDYDGYHDEARIASTRIAYAIVCTCPGFDGPGETTEQQVTVAASHELVESATDPYFQTASAYAQTDDDHAVWTVVTEGEVADMCELNTDADVVPADGTLTVQRTWSNAAAAAGKNPCVPAPELYSGTEPDFATTGNINYGGNWATQVVKIPLGQTGTVDLPLFTNGISAPWSVVAMDYNADYEGGARLLNLSLDRPTGNNGDTLKLTITPNGFDSQLRASIFIIESHFGDGSQSLAMGVVTAQ